jgi:hypothetical protein
MLLLVAILVAGVSLGLLLYLTGLLWNAAAPPLRGIVERRRLQYYSERAARGDQLLRDGELQQALRVFEACLYPNPAMSSALAAAIQRHHTGLLSRFLAAADGLQGERVRLMSLAKADRLFDQRKLLQGRYLAGDRRRAIDGEFRDNTRALREALHNLADEVIAAQRESLH